MSCMDKIWQKGKSSQQSCEESWFDGSCKFDNHCGVKTRLSGSEKWLSALGTWNLAFMSFSWLHKNCWSGERQHLLTFWLQLRKMKVLNSLVWGWMMEGELSFRTPPLGKIGSRWKKGPCGWATSSQKWPLNDTVHYYSFTIWNLIHFYWEVAFFSSRMSLEVGAPIISAHWGGFYRRLSHWWQMFSLLVCTLHFPVQGALAQVILQLFSRLSVLFCLVFSEFQ